MLIWNQKEDAFYNSDNIVEFCIVDDDTSFSITADFRLLGEYSSYDDALKNMKELERQIIFGATTYKMP